MMDEKASRVIKNLKKYYNFFLLKIYNKINYIKLKVKG